MDDLTSQEQKNFEAAKTLVFDLNNFTQMFQSRTHAEQIEDLTKYGFTNAELVKLGIEIVAAGVTENEEATRSEDEAAPQEPTEDENEKKHDF
jgi:hypothetical protein